MAKKAGEYTSVCSLDGSIGSNQVLWYNWLFSCFMILSPSSSICFRRVTELNLWNSHHLVWSEGHSEVFWVWQHCWLFWLMLCGMKWDLPLPAPRMSCSCKHWVVSVGCISWQDTCSAVQKRRGRFVVMRNVMFKFIQLLSFSNWGNVGFYSMIPGQLWNSSAALWGTETFQQSFHLYATAFSAFSQLPKYSVFQDYGFAVTTHSEKACCLFLSEEKLFSKQAVCIDPLSWQGKSGH